MTQMVERVNVLPRYGDDAEDWLSGEHAMTAAFALGGSSRMWTVALFPVPMRHDPDARLIIQRLSAWTGWSNRSLAHVLDSSHTTVGALLQGRPLQPSRSGDLGDRLADVYQIVERAYRLTNDDAARTARVVAVADESGKTAVDYLRDRNSAAAYLAIVDALRPRPRGLLTGSRPARLDATAALSE